MMPLPHLGEGDDAPVEVGEGEVGGAIAYSRMRIVAHALERRRMGRRVSARPSSPPGLSYGRNSMAEYIWLKAWRAGPVVYSFDRVIARHPTVNRRIRSAVPNSYSLTVGTRVT